MQQVELSVSSMLRATWSDIRDTLLHEIAHAITPVGWLLIVVSILVVVQASAQNAPVAVLRAAAQGGAIAQFNLGSMHDSAELSHLRGAEECRYINP